MSELGPKNPRLDRLRRLARDGRARREHDAFVIEGPKLVGDALAAGVEVDAVYAEPGAPSELLDAARDAGVPVHAVVAGGLARVVDATTPQPVAATARRRHVEVDAISADAPALVLAAIGDPGNAGTLLRSAEAAGFGAVLFTAGSVDPFAPKCVRASAGSLFRVDVVIGGGAGTVLHELAARGRHRLGTSAVDGAAYDVVDLPSPLALVLGNEAHGLPDDVAVEIDSWVSIPMAGGTESLNVAMAGTLLCFEVARRGSHR